MYSKFLAFAVVLGIGLPGCDGLGLGLGQKEQFGAVSGVVAGGLIGGQLGGSVATGVVGALIGGFIGQQIGSSLDQDDQRRAWEAQYNALQYSSPGHSVVWRNSESGDHGRVVVGPYYKRQSLSCRSYTHTIYIGGRPQVAKGDACLRRDGTWRVVS